MNMQIHHRSAGPEKRIYPSDPKGSERLISPYEYDFLKSFLHAVYSGRFENPDINIVRCVSHTSLNHRPLRPTIIDTTSESFPLVGDGVLEVTVNWRGGLYEVNVSRESTSDGLRLHMAFCLSLSEEASSPKKLLDLLLRESVANSYFKHEVLRVTGNPMGEHSLNVKSCKVTGQGLGKLMLGEETKEAVGFLIETIKNYSAIQRPLRYLLEGKPGTGKTEIVRTIIEATRGYATFLLIEGVVELIELFDFAALFSPAVVCLDDLDLIFGNRQDAANRERLGEFLGVMDGLSNSNVFVLATTNDKRWVDQAAARPGRFDAVIDTDIVDPKLYRHMICERCPNESIVKSFTGGVIDVLGQKRVSGAFIMNLIKYLEIASALRPETVNEEIVLRTIERMHRGFYRTPRTKEESFGFAPN